jgi:hypothetical protein
MAFLGKSGVNVRRLVKNIADLYPFEPQLAALIELIANSIDAKSENIFINYNSEKGIVETADDGIGMNKKQFKEYHNFATSTKERGTEIGFAGLGAKLALNFCEKVITETRSDEYQGFSEWGLKGDNAPFKIYHDETLSLANNYGTKVTFYLNSYNRNFYSESGIIDILYEHFYPMLDPDLRKNYERPVKIFVNGKEIMEEIPLSMLLEEVEQITVKVREQIKGGGFVGIAKKQIEKIHPGIAVCTFGKVIERTYFKKEPRNKENIYGWIEAPYLMNAVTTDKSRFQITATGRRRK